MTLSGMSPLFLAASLAAAALGLYVLHRLQVRPRPVRVPTLAFWKSVARPTRARRLFGPFRHPRTYAFLLLLFAAILAALAEPDFDGGAAAERRVLLVIDAGPSLQARDAAGMTRAAGLGAAVADALDATGLGADVRIVALGAGLTELAAEATPRPLARERLLALQSSTVPADAHAAAALLAQDLERRPGQLVVFSDREAALAPVFAAHGLKPQFRWPEALPQIPAWTQARVLGDVLQIAVASPRGALAARFEVAFDDRPPVRIGVDPALERSVLSIEIPSGARRATGQLVGTQGARLGPILELDLGRAPRPASLFADGPGAEPLVEFLRESGWLASAASPDAVTLLVVPGSQAPAEDRAAQILAFAPRGMALTARAPALSGWPRLRQNISTLAPIADGVPLVVDGLGQPVVQRRGASGPVEFAAGLLDPEAGLLSRPEGVGALLSLCAALAGEATPELVVSADAALAAVDFGRSGEPGLADPAIADGFLGAEAATSAADRFALAGERRTRPDHPSLGGTARGGLASAPLTSAAALPPSAGVQRAFRPFELLVALALGLALVEAALSGRRRIP